MENLRKILIDNNLKVTPQRLSLLEAFENLKNHPSAEAIIEYVHSKYPNIAVGTIYKTLETFVEKGIIQKVKNKNGVARYDNITTKHHHLYSVDNEIITDFYDEDLNLLLENYFKQKEIPHFKIEDIKLQIIGKFIDNKDKM